jgi:hypothetical protein
MVMPNTTEASHFFCFLCISHTKFGHVAGANWIARHGDAMAVAQPGFEEHRQGSNDFGTHLAHSGMVDRSSACVWSFWAL